MLVRLTGIALAALIGLAGCGDSGGTTDDTGSAEPDVTTESDATDEPEDSAGAAPEDVADDAGPEDVEEDVAEDGCAHPCLNEFGKNDKKLCPAPQSEWNCIDGCCVPVFKCATDEDCAVTGFDEGHCTDEDYACRCDVSSGVCFTWYCGTDDECGDGKVCDAGSCVTLGADLEVRIVTRSVVLTPGATAQVLADGVDTSDPALVTAVDVTWSSDDDDVVSIDPDGVVTGGDVAGVATITATSGDTSANLEIHNVVPDPAATLTVVALTEDDLEPVTGHYALVASDTGDVLEMGPIGAGGIVSFDGDIGAGVDVHLLGDGTDWVSWLGATGPLLYVPVSRSFWGEITLDKQADVVPEETELVGANVLRGTVDFSQYLKEGELDLTLSSFPFAAGLFDFNLQTILGANVKRFFHPEAQIPGVGGDSVAEIPGGLTFAIAGPAVPEFVLAAPKGEHRVWTLGGRIRLDEVAEYSDDIFSAFSGDSINFSVLVSALVPLFADFYSTLTPTPAFAGDGEPTVEEIQPALRVPMGLATTFEVPPLPPMAGLGYADALFVIGAAVTPDALVVPLGLNAGADTADPGQWPPDGIVDGDPTTPQTDPITLAYSPLHSGLAGPHARYGVAVVAASLTPDGNDPRPEGGSAILHRGEPAEALEETLDLPDFLAFPMASTWDAETRGLSIEAVDGADLQRVLFKGKKGDNWTVWLNGASDYVMPDPATLLGVDPADAPADRTANTELVLVNSFDLADDVTPEELFVPGGVTLRLLLHVADRASFVDIGK